MAALAWYVHVVYSHHGMWSFPLDLTVYRDAGLIVRHVRPSYRPYLASPLLDWPGPPVYAGIKFIYPPFAALPFEFMSILPLRIPADGARAQRPRPARRCFIQGAVNVTGQFQSLPVARRGLAQISLEAVQAPTSLSVSASPLRSPRSR